MGCAEAEPKATPNPHPEPSTPHPAKPKHPLSDLSEKGASLPHVDGAEAFGE